MADMAVRAGTDEFVAFFQSDSGAPVFAEVPARPHGHGDSYDGNGDAELSDGRPSGNEARRKPATAKLVLEHQNIRTGHEHDLNNALAARFALLDGLN